MALVSLTTACSVFGASSYQEPDYDVLTKQRIFEVRSYKPMILAVTTNEQSTNGSRNINFRTLFDYISGENIAMTTPVYEDTASTSIPMTTPVYQEQNKQSQMMAFVLPSKYTLETAPKPTNDQVTLKQVPQRKMAAITFSGLMGDEKIAAKTAMLQSWLEDNNYTIMGDFMTASYNPPFTLPPFRRNEVLVEIK